MGLAALFSCIFMFGAFRIRCIICIFQRGLVPRMVFVWDLEWTVSDHVFLLLVISILAGYSA